MRIYFAVWSSARLLAQSESPPSTRQEDVSQAENSRRSNYADQVNGRKHGKRLREEVKVYIMMLAHENRSPLSHWNILGSVESGEAT